MQPDNGCATRLAARRRIVVGVGIVLALLIVAWIAYALISSLLDGPQPAPTTVPASKSPLPPSSETLPPSPTSELGTSNIYIEYILDASGSMNETLPDGTLKLEVAKNLLTDHLGAFHPETNIGLRAYGHRLPYQQTEESCRDIELIAPVEKGQLETIVTWLRGFAAQGMTPLAESIRQAMADFVFEPGRINSIVMLSDGIETCEGDPCGLVEELKAAGINFTIHVIGLDVDGATREQLRCIAEAGGGTYYDVETEQDLAEALDDIQETVTEDEVIVPPGVDTPSPISPVSDLDPQDILLTGVAGSSSEGGSGFHLVVGEVLAVGSEVPECVTELEDARVEGVRDQCLGEWLAEIQPGEIDVFAGDEVEIFGRVTSMTSHGCGIYIGVCESASYYLRYAQPTSPGQDEPVGDESFSIKAAQALAPISILSKTEYPGLTEDYSYMQFEVDQAGNVHILIHWGWDDDEEGEIYVVDGVVYARDSGVGEDDFTVVEDPEYLALLADPFDAVFSVHEGSEDIFETFPLHTILWAGAYASVEPLGAETVNGFLSDEYRLVVDPTELSDLRGLWRHFDDLADWISLDQDNAVVDVWIEPSTGAIVKAEWQLITDEGIMNATLEVMPLNTTRFVPPPVEPAGTTAEETTPHGTIAGGLSYPSEYIPAMTIYARNIDTYQTFSVRVPEGTLEYWLDIPVEGSYFVFAWTDTGVGASYSRFVTCGLRAECSDHTLIPVSVKLGESVTGIDIADWYWQEAVPEP